MLHVCYLATTKGSYTQPATPSVKLWKNIGQQWKNPQKAWVNIVKITYF